MTRDGSRNREADELFNRNEREPRFHPLIDNQMLFVTDEGGDSDIYVKSAFLEGDSPTNANVTANFASNETLGAWAPDGSILAYLCDGGGVRHVWLSDPAGRGGASRVRAGIHMARATALAAPNRTEPLSARNAGPRGDWG